MTGAFQHVPAAGLSAAATACASIGVDAVTVDFSSNATTISGGSDSASVVVRLPGDGTGRARRSVRVTELHARHSSRRVTLTAAEGSKLQIEGRTTESAKAAKTRSHPHPAGADITLAATPADFIALLAAVSPHSKSLTDHLDGKVHLKIARGHGDAPTALTATAAGSYAAATNTVETTLVRGDGDTEWEVWVHGPALRAGTAALNARAKEWTVTCSTSKTGHRVHLSDGVTEIATVVDPAHVPDIVTPLAAPDRSRCWDFDITDVPALSAFLDRLPAPAEGTSPFVQIRNERGTHELLHQAKITAQVNGRAVPCVARRGKQGAANRGVATSCAEDVAVDVPLVQLRALVATAAAHKAPSMVLRGYTPYRTMAKLFAHPTSGTGPRFTAVTIARVPEAA